jgi:hypothetical protein
VHKRLELLLEREQHALGQGVDHGQVRTVLDPDR